MKKEITVVIKSHPHARQYNWLGGPMDIKNHEWVHVNVKFLAKPEQYEVLQKAFSTSTPFGDLDWLGCLTCPTQTISRWTVRESPVAKEEGDSLWLAFECLQTVPSEFLQYLANRFQIQIQASYCPPYATKWLVLLYAPTEII
jgi:hypothetical protein